MAALPRRPGSMNEHMTRVHMKILEQKLDNTRNEHRPTHGDAGTGGGLDPQRIRYHQSLLKRQELLERIKEASKPVGLQERGTYDRAPYHEDPRPQSLPEIRNKSRGPVSSSAVGGRQSRRNRRNSLEEISYNDQIHTPPPRNYQQPLRAQPVQQPPLVQPMVYQQPTVLGTHLVLPSQPQQQGNKSEFYDMMMMQNAQMHQLFMQQMLAQGLNQPKQEPQTLVIEHAAPPPPPALPQPQYITLPKAKKKKAAKHYHHYNQLPPIRNDERPLQVNHIHHTEPRQETPPKMAAKPSVQRVLSPEYDQVRPRLRPPPISQPPPAPVAQRPKHPFPGSKALRKLRHIFYAAWFVSFLRVAARKRKEGVDEKFLFGIRLKEAVGGLHRIYLNPDGNIYPLLRDIISPGAEDLTKAFNANNQKELQELVYVTENIVYHMTDIMPKTGVLGTHKKAVIFEMLQPGKTFPDGYFWQVESAKIDFDEEGKTGEVDDSQAKLLLVGLFVSRGLVTTLLMKPLDYGMSSTILDEIAEQNLRLLASIFIYIIRKVYMPNNNKMMAMPSEVARYLYTDDELKPLLDKIKPTMEYVDELLREWIKEYTRRLRAAKAPR